MESPSILMIEDNSADAEMWTLAMTQLGMPGAMARVKDGISALALISKRSDGAQAFKLIISDYLVPGLHGDQLMQVLRAHRGSKTTPVIIISGILQPGTKVNGIPWFEKPADYRSLLALIERLRKSYPKAFGGECEAHARPVNPRLHHATSTASRPGRPQWST